MKSCPARLLRISTLLFLFLALIEKIVFGATESWTNSGSGAWSVAANWSSNQSPGLTFGSLLITNSNSKTVIIDSSTSASTLSIQTLTLSAPAGSTNTLALVNATTNNPLQLSASVSLDLGGSLTLTNSQLNSAGIALNHGAVLNITNSIVQESGALTTVDIINGNIWLDSGLLDLSSIQAIRIGRTNNAAGTLTINGGSVLAPLVQVGTTTSASGVLNIPGGVLNASAAVTIGSGVNSTGIVSVTGGTLLATNDETYIGKQGQGQMTINSGNATFAFVSVGNNNDGNLSVNGGQLTLRPRTTNDWLQIGYTRNGQFNLTAGTVLSFGELHVGDDSSGLGTGSGNALITGGQLIATNDTTAIGRYGPGIMTISNATAWLTNVSVGRHDGAVGTLNVQSNAQVYMLDALSIGRFAGSQGHVLVNGGLISLTNDIVWVGREGSGDMTISSGTVRAVSAFVAVSTVVTDAVTQVVTTNTPVGSLTLAGGTMMLTSNLLVGSSLLSTGQVVVAGGNLSLVGNGGATWMSIQSGTFELDSGNVATDSLFLTNNTGQFTFNGGTLQAKSLVVSNGLPFVVGNGAGPAVLQLEGGTYSFANGLVISSNATVTGCGTIIGPITNSGTLSTNCSAAGVTITKATRSGTTATIFFTTINSSNHVLEYKKALSDASWTAILPGVIGDGSITNKADVAATNAARFYRIHLQ